MEHEVGKVPWGCSDDSFRCGDDGWGHGWPEDSRSEFVAQGFLFKVTKPGIRDFLRSS